MKTQLLTLLILALMLPPSGCSTGSSGGSSTPTPEDTDPGTPDPEGKNPDETGPDETAEPGDECDGTSFQSGCLNGYRALRTFVSTETHPGNGLYWQMHFSADGDTQDQCSRDAKNAGLEKHDSEGLRTEFVSVVYLGKGFTTNNPGDNPLFSHEEGRRFGCQQHNTSFACRLGFRGMLTNHSPDAHDGFINDPITYLQALSATDPRFTLPLITLNSGSNEPVTLSERGEHPHSVFLSLVAGSITLTASGSDMSTREKTVWTGMQLSSSQGEGLSLDQSTAASGHAHDCVNWGLGWNDPNNPSETLKGGTGMLGKVDSHWLGQNNSFLEDDCDVQKLHTLCVEVPVFPNPTTNQEGL